MTDLQLVMGMHEKIALKAMLILIPKFSYSGATRGVLSETFEVSKKLAETAYEIADAMAAEEAKRASAVSEKYERVGSARCHRVMDQDDCIGITLNFSEKCPFDMENTYKGCTWTKSDVFIEAADSQEGIRAKLRKREALK